ncbi:hypothetical protein J6590_105282 [Homalodisca vitripennis]|nr:hypothetical protein J6590_105282 [Homalodisca vitripennis]
MNRSQSCEREHKNHLRLAGVDEVANAFYRHLWLMKMWSRLCYKCAHKSWIFQTTQVLSDLTLLCQQSGTNDFRTTTKSGSFSGKGYVTLRYLNALVSHVTYWQLSSGNLSPSVTEFTSVIAASCSTGGEVITLLNIYRKYPCLWDVNSPEYLKRDLKKHALKVVIKELEDAGLSVDEDTLKKMIQSDSGYVSLLTALLATSPMSFQLYLYPPHLLIQAVCQYTKGKISSPTKTPNSGHPNKFCSKALSKDLSTLTQEEEEVTKNGQEVCSNGPEQASTLLGSTKPNLGLSNKWSLSTSVMATPSRPIKTIKTNWTTKYPSRFESAINKLQGITEVASQGLLQAPATVEDQYDAFSKHIASQMRELPIRSHFAT